jgi:hypothetical protein
LRQLIRVRAGSHHPWLLRPNRSGNKVGLLGTGMTLGSIRPVRAQ